MLKDSSLDAYFDVKKSGKLQAQQAKIISVMHPGVDYTRRELSYLSQIETSTVSARINAMLDIHVEIVGKRICSISGKNVESLRLIN